MDIIDTREFILSLPHVEEVQPFKDDDILIYEIGGKWFAVYILERPEFLAVKCIPDRAILLRDKFSAITPAWHFNKKHWNDLYIDRLPSEIVKREIRHSYLTVIQKNVTPKALREELLAAAMKENIEDASTSEL